MNLDLVGWWLPALGFALAMSLSPGPNNVMMAASGANFGLWRSVPHMLGVSVGFPVMLAVIAFGAGGPLRAWPWLQQALHWVGAAYLGWLAWRIARARPDPDGAAAARPPRPLGFVQAALFQWVNPKAWVAAAGAVVTYTSALGASFALQAGALAGMFLVTSLLAVALWTAVGAGAARLLRTPRAMRGFNLAMAALLALSLVPMLLE